MENTENLRNTATKIIIEGGNNIEKIGGSSTVIFHQDEKGQVTRIMYDCGALFPPEDVNVGSFVADVLKYLDVDDNSLKAAFPNVRVQDINRVREIYKKHGIRSKKADALFVTHMHGDHVGGLVNLLLAGVKFPKIYASAPTLGLIERLCRNKGISNLPEMVEIIPYETVKISDSVEVSAIPVSHSTIGSYAYYTKTKYNGQEVGILNCGDYHTGEVPIGVGFNAKEFTNFMKGKPLNNVLMDSTSTDLDGSVEPVTYEEAIQNISNICATHIDKMVVSPVISRSTVNLYNFLEAARQTGRKVFLEGCMLRHTYDVLQRQGWFDDYKDVVFHSSDVLSADVGKYLAQVPLEKRLITFSGAFGEGETCGSIRDCTFQNPSSFVKFVNGYHPSFQRDILGKCVIVAAQRMIPVGSVPIRQRSMYQKAFDGGAKVIQTAVEKSHSLGNYDMERLQRSGHASAKETVELVKLCRAVRSNKKDTLFVLPIHGDFNQLFETAKITQGIRIQSFVPSNGSVIDVDQNYTYLRNRRNSENPITWLGFREDLDAYGNTVGYQMSEWAERRKGLIGVSYEKIHSIGFIPSRTLGHGKVVTISRNSVLTNIRQQIIKNDGKQKKKA